MSQCFGTRIHAKNLTFQDRSAAKNYLYERRQRFGENERDRKWRCEHDGTPYVPRKLKQIKLGRCAVCKKLCVMKKDGCPYAHELSAHSRRWDGRAGQRFARVNLESVSYNSRLRAGNPVPTGVGFGDRQWVWGTPTSIGELQYTATLHSYDPIRSWEYDLTGTTHIQTPLPITLDLTTNGGSYTLYPEEAWITTGNDQQWRFWINGDMLVRQTNAITVQSNHIVWSEWHTMTTGHTLTITNDPIWNGWTQARQPRQPALGVQPNNVECVECNDLRGVQAINRNEQHIRDREAWLRRQEAMVARKAEAIVVAEALLLEFLNDDQRAQYLEKKFITVVGSDGGVYDIRLGHAGNVYQLNPEGERVASYCAHPVMRVMGSDGNEGYLPDQDAMLAQMLALVTDEQHFLQRANRHWIRPEQRQLVRN